MRRAAARWRPCCRSPIPVTETWRDSAPAAPCAAVVPVTWPCPGCAQQHARLAAAPDDLNDSFKRNWNEVVTRQRPFAGVPCNENDVLEVTGGLAGLEETKPAVLYASATMPQECIPRPR